MQAKEIAKRNDLLRRSIPSRCKSFRFTSGKFCLRVTSYNYTDTVSWKHFYFSRSRGGVAICHRFTCYQHRPVRGARRDSNQIIVIQEVHNARFWLLMGEHIRILEYMRARIKNKRDSRKKRHTCFKGFQGQSLASLVITWSDQKGHQKGRC